MDIAEIAKAMGARPADIPGLWWLDGYAELTTGQLLQLWDERGRR